MLYTVSISIWGQDVSQKAVLTCLHAENYVCSSHSLYTLLSIKENRAHQGCVLLHPKLGLARHK